MIFESLYKTRSGPVNLAEYAPGWLKRKGYDGRPKSPLNDPEICAWMVRNLHEERRYRWSYGGYGEDRRELWRGSYLEATGAFVHLGVDFNAPVGTAVDSDHLLWIVDTDDDPSPGGWGTYLIGRINGKGPPIYLLYAHLGTVLVMPSRDFIEPGEMFGRIGEPHENGHWYPHCHVQALTQAGYDRYKRDPQAFDGYCRKEDWARYSKEFFPDPLEFIKVS